MTVKKYINSVSNLYVNNRLLKFVVVVLALMQVYNFIAMNRTINQQKTVLIPVGLSEQTLVGALAVDSNYLNAMSMYISSLIYSSTPASVEKQFSMLLELLSTEAYAKYSENLLLSAVQQNKNQVTITSKIHEIVMQTEPLKQITVKLEYDKYIFSELVEHNVKTNIVISYEIKNGRFTITDLQL